MVPCQLFRARILVLLNAENSHGWLHDCNNMYYIYLLQSYPIMLEYRERASALVFMNTKNGKECEKDAWDLRKMFHSLCTNVTFILNPNSRVR